MNPERPRSYVLVTKHSCYITLTIKSCRVHKGSKSLVTSHLSPVTPSPTFVVSLSACCRPLFKCVFSQLSDPFRRVLPPPPRHHCSEPPATSASRSSISSHHCLNSRGIPAGKTGPQPEPSHNSQLSSRGTILLLKM